MNKRGLGKGLGALIPQDDAATGNSVQEIKITDIEANDNQPRRKFDDESLKSLADSIKEHGVVQPIILTRVGEGYKIVAGERRWRAARIAGLKSIPAIIKDYTKVEVMQIALIENIQREDLNPIEEASAYKALIDEYSLTQDEIAKKLSRSRSAIANSLRLINLPKEITQMIIDNKLSAGHGRTLLAIQNPKTQIEIANRIMKEQLSVRQVENLVKALENKKTEKKVEKKNYEILEIEEKLKTIFATKVSISKKKKGGKIEIEYYSDEELERILEVMEK